ncbi:MAG: SCO family protein [Sedimenticola sp.]
MRQKPKRSPIYKLILFTVALAALYGGYHWGNKYSSYYVQTLNLHLMQTPLELETFQLTDQHNQPFTNERLEGHWSLVIFGYSNSEQTAHEMLTLATRVHNRLAATPDLQKQMQTVFVTVDPKRDTAAVLAPFIDHFSSDFIALTGEESEIRNLAKQLGVVYQARSSDADAVIDHSTSMALIDPDGELTGLFKGRVSAAEMAADIETVSER